MSSLKVKLPIVGGNKLNEKQFNELITKFDILTKAFALFVISDQSERKNKIWLLKAMGLPNNDIALIFNTSPESIRATLSKVRTEKNKNE